MPNSSGTPVPESEWLAFVASLPTEDPAARMRVLRSLDSLGCSVLREGVYLLPDTPAIRQGLARLSDQVALISGTSYVLCLSSIDHAQSRTFRSLFDRSAKYEELTKTVQGLTVGFGVSEPVAISRLLNKQRREFEAISALDFFPSEARERAAQALRQTEEQVRALMAPDPPKSTPVTQSGHFYLKRIWATRHPLRDDRLASAWLIRRFIDPEATLIWLERDQECPSTAIGFGFEGAAFNSTGSKVTFEELLGAFQLEKNATLVRIGAWVQCLDAGGPEIAEAAGVEALLQGARRRANSEEELLLETETAFDLLYEAYLEPQGKHEG